MSDATACVTPFEAAFLAERGHLWGVSYRLTGSAADADDIVQETFVRALEKPPARLDEPLRPWLVRVAVNLGLDLLRRRKRSPYVGAWLPSPADLGEETRQRRVEPFTDEAARYELTEAASYAFLVALEALTPKQRAVLILRDVFDYTGAETAGVLGVSEAVVRTTHHRARKAMAAYDRSRSKPTPALRDATRHALEEFMRLLNAGDAKGLEALLAEDVRATGDGGGEYSASLHPFVGRAAVTRLYVGLMAANADRIRSVTIRDLNGLPAIVMDVEPRPPAVPPRAVLAVTLDEAGRIAAIHSIVAPRKLTHVR